MNKALIEDKTILVTFGTRSAGKHLIRQCLRRGAKQVIATGTTDEFIEAAKRDIGDDDRVQWMVCDLAKPSHRAKLVADLSDVELDGILHNAASVIAARNGDSCRAIAKETSFRIARETSFRRGDSPQRSRAVSPVAYLSYVPLCGVTYDDPGAVMQSQVKDTALPQSPRSPRKKYGLDRFVNELEEDMTVNFRAPVILTNSLLPGLAQRPQGAFVCFVTPEAPTHTASKAALQSHAKSLAAELQGSAPSIKVMVRELAAERGRPCPSA